MNLSPFPSFLRLTQPPSHVWRRRFRRESLLCGVLQHHLGFCSLIASLETSYPDVSRDFRGGEGVRLCSIGEGSRVTVQNPPRYELIKELMLQNGSYATEKNWRGNNRNTCLLGARCHSFRNTSPSPPWGVILATVMALLSYRLSEKAFNFIFGKEKPEQAALELVALPHYKGWQSPAPVEERRLADAKDDSLGGAPAKLLITHKIEYTHPDAKFLKDSQSLVVYKYNLYDEKLYEKYAIEMELIVKFGVIRVRSLSGSINRCKAEARFRTFEIGGKSIDSPWGEGGYLNWYSPELKEEIVPQLPVINPRRLWGINKYLLSTEQEITKNQTKDLLVFYMIKDTPNVFLCSSVNSVPVGIIENDSPVRFELEITLSGEGYSATKWLYRVKVLWDDFEIDRVE